LSGDGGLEIFCAGDLVLPVEQSLTSIGVGTAIATSLFTIYPSVYTSIEEVNGTVEYSPTDSDDALQRLMWGEIDFAIVSVSLIYPHTPLLRRWSHFLSL
jgi:hypothetical protein